MRNQVYNALLDLGAGLTWGAGLTFKTTSRRPKTPQAVVGLTPALFQAEYLEETTQRRGMPALRVWHVGWLIYHVVSDPNAIPSTTNSEILDAIDTLFPPADAEAPPGQPGPQTLGGLVHRVWKEGTTETYGGNSDSTVLIVVPLKIMVP